MQRLSREYAELTQTPVDDVQFEFDQKNMYQAIFYIKGPENTPYEGGDFKFSLQIKENYPFKAPTIKCLTSIYNPNITKEGEICQQIFEWTPKMKIRELIQKIQVLLVYPNQPDPLVVEIANELNENKELFEKKAKEHTDKYAKGQ